MPAYRQRLKEWGLESDEPVGTVIFAATPEDVAAIIASHPESDFFLPRRHPAAVSSDTHDAITVSPDYVLLLSQHSLLAPATRWSCRL